MQRRVTKKVLKDTIYFGLGMFYCHVLNMCTFDIFQAVKKIMLERVRSITVISGDQP